MEERNLIDEHGHIEDDMPTPPSRVQAPHHSTSAATPAQAPEVTYGLDDDDTPRRRFETSGLDDDEDDEALDDLEDLDLDGVDDPDGVLGSLIERLQNVVSALNETEQENHAMQDEIKQLLADQEEQEELRDELDEQLRQRGELVSKIAQQTLADNESSTDIMERMARLRAESEREKGAFRMEMSRLDGQLAKLMDESDAPEGAR